jgi:chromosome segregation ATPase
MINEASLDNLKPFKGAWRQGKTTTIRVPITLAEQLLALARRLDDGESLDTSEKTAELYERIGRLTRQCDKLEREAKNALISLDTAEDTIAELKGELATLKSDLAARSRETDELTAIVAKRDDLKSRETDELTETSMPDAATLLNQLKVKRKKSKIDLQDVEAILELIEA